MVSYLLMGGRKGAMPPFYFPLIPWVGGWFCACLWVGEGDKGRFGEMPASRFYATLKYLCGGWFYICLWVGEGGKAPFYFPLIPWVGGWFYTCL